MIFYRYIPADRAILIVHVLHGARNLETLLHQDQE
jgi:plasmid stabilization system protein ParE